MKRNCQICGKEYNPAEYPSFFYMKYCSEKCEQKAAAEAKAIQTGVHMFMCVQPLQVVLVDAKSKEPFEEIIQEGSKWQRDELQSHGLNAVHLVNLSGRKDEPVTWIEIDDEALNKHFERY